MILTSHRLDCFRLCIDLLEAGGSFAKFDRVVLLLNGVEGRHRQAVDRIVAAHADVPWDTVAGPRGRGERISGLQNECVRRHPEALYFKIDEDTFVSRDWVDRLQEAYDAHRGDPDLSLITPVIPNNAVGFDHLLMRFPNLMDEYRNLFPYPADARCDGSVWQYPKVAEWITRKHLRLDAANAALRNGNPTPFQRFSHRFSINCIVYDYRHWREIGGVPAQDEVGWGEWIPAHGKFVVLATNCLVHHYAFFVQQDGLDRTTLLEDLRLANVDCLPPLPGLWRQVPRLARTLQQAARKAREKLRPPSSS